MVKVNYVREHMRFMEYAVDAELTLAERTLWYVLMHIFNRRARGSEWPDGFVGIGNRRLMLYCGIGFDALAKARAGLRRRGLIDYVEGRRNAREPAYRMNYFTVEAGDRPGEGPEEEAWEDEDGADRPPQEASYPQAREVVRSNEGQKTARPPVYSRSNPPAYPVKTDKGGDKPGDKGPDLSININDTNKPEPKRNPNQGGSLEEEEETNPAASAARSALARAWEDAYGREPTPAVLKCLLWRCVRISSLAPPLVCEAVNMAALRCADSPVDYILALCRDWSRRGIRTVDALEEYLEEGA